MEEEIEYNEPKCIGCGLDFDYLQEKYDWTDEQRASYEREGYCPDCM